MAAQTRVEGKAQTQADRLKAKEAEEAQKQLDILSKSSANRLVARPKKLSVAPVVTVGGELQIGVVSKQAGIKARPD